MKANLPLGLLTIYIPPFLRSLTPLDDRLKVTQILWYFVEMTDFPFLLQPLHIPSPAEHKRHKRPTAVPRKDAQIPIPTSSYSVPLIDQADMSVIMALDLSK